MILILILIFALACGASASLGNIIGRHEIKRQVKQQYGITLTKYGCSG
jgi:hypothetical protein